MELPEASCKARGDPAVRPVVSVSFVPLEIRHRGGCPLTDVVPCVLSATQCSVVACCALLLNIFRTR